MSLESTSLRTYLDTLLTERDVTRHYGNSLRRRVDAFGDYLGRMATLADLSPEALNAYVQWLQEKSGWLPKTIRDYQAAIVLVWREAFDRRDVDAPPWRLRRVKVPKRIVRAWTQDELRAILAATKWLRGDVPGTRIWKRDWFRAYILTAYCTGIRRCDLMNHALREDFREGMLTVVENKTGKVVSRIVSPRAQAALDLVIDDTYILPWPGRVRRFYGSFTVLVRRAGVTPGGPHKIRKSAGSYGQRVNGNGQLLLGHEDPATFQRHYNDLSISLDVPEPPPEL